MGIYLEVFLIVYVLMNNKKETAYTRVLRKIKELFDIELQYIFSDFESALMNAASTCFKNSFNFACIFHLGQNN